MNSCNKVVALPVLSLRSWISTAFLALIGILPISGTIALRNLLLLMLLGMLGYAWFRDRQTFSSPVRDTLVKLPASAKFWPLFLLCFPIWAVESQVALHNLLGQWGESLLAALVGVCVYAVLGKRGPSIFALAVASSVPLVVHLLLWAAFWFGVLSSAVVNTPELGVLWNSIGHAWQPVASPVWSWSNLVTVVFLGIEPMHGNLGYTACQAIALYCVSAIVAWREHRVGAAIAACAGVAMSFLSIFVAHSRGAILFAVLLLAMAFLTAAVKYRRIGAGNGHRPKASFASNPLIPTVLGLAVIVMVSAGYVSVRNDVRWTSMADKVQIALFSDAPTSILCEGVSAQMQEHVSQRYGGHDPAYAKVLIEGLTGDGGRILLMRAGFDLALESPRGLDGSRDAYKKLIEQKCGHVPSLQFAHSHQGWIDLSLALGWVGVVIYASVLAQFSILGWRGISHPVAGQWAFGLLLVSVFWVLRGFADAVYREHYLQMQALLLAYLFSRMVSDGLALKTSSGVEARTDS